jgi:hypothetical protein
MDCSNHICLQKIYFSKRRTLVFGTLKVGQQGWLTRQAGQVIRCANIFTAATNTGNIHDKTGGAHYRSVYVIMLVVVKIDPISATIVAKNILSLKVKN